jgi:cytochrome c biogenesis protein CcmG, thiol:disulfide interchange protein DsbE
VIAFAAGCGSSTAANEGKPAPDFSGTTLDGQSVSLGMYRGKPLVLAFMASW